MITTCVNCERLRSELAHMRTQAGPSSCADYAVKNAELTAEVGRLRKLIGYVDHLSTCHLHLTFPPSDARCTCGLAEVIR